MNASLFCFVGGLAGVALFVAVYAVVRARIARRRLPASVVVVDVETTGLDPAKHSILSIGAVALASGAEFHAECRARDGAEVEEQALGVNGFTLARVHDVTLRTPVEIVAEFEQWCQSQGLRLLAGMNPGFDLGFIKAERAKDSRLRFVLSHRSVDLHSLAYARAFRRGIQIPATGFNTDDLYATLGLKGEAWEHNALGGARREAEAFRILLCGIPRGKEGV